MPQQTIEQMQEQLLHENWRVADAARGSRDLTETLAITAGRLRRPHHEIFSRYAAGEDGVVVEGPAGYALHELDAGMTGESMLGLIDRRLDVKRIDRAYRISRSQTSDLDAPRAVRELDVKVAAATVAEAEERVEQALPDRILGKVDQMNIAPEVRKGLVAALKARDPKVLESTLITEQVVVGPSGGLVQVTTVAPWDPVTNPRIVDRDELVRRYGMGARQRNLLELMKVERTRAILEMRGYPVEASIVGLTTVDGAA